VRTPGKTRQRQGVNKKPVGGGKARKTLHSVTPGLTQGEKSEAQEMHSLTVHRCGAAKKTEEGRVAWTAAVLPAVAKYRRTTTENHKLCREKYPPGAKRDFKGLKSESKPSQFWLVKEKRKEVERGCSMVSKDDSHTTQKN